MPPNRLLPICAAAAIAAALLPAASAAVPAVTDQVVLNEVRATPADGAVEAIELYNPSTEAVDVTGWTLDDGDYCIPHEDAPDPVALEGAVGAGSTKVVELPNPNGGFSCLNLAQGGDAVTLADDGGQRVDAVCWGDDCQETPEAHEAPADVPAGNTAYRCFLFSGEGEGLSDGDRGEVDWTSGSPSVGSENDPCLF
jgi:hypothetical protein